MAPSSNGGVDCLVVKISLGGRLFAAAHCATAWWQRGKGEDCIGKRLSACRQILVNLLLSLPFIVIPISAQVLPANKPNLFAKDTFVLSVTLIEFTQNMKRSNTLIA